MLGVPVGLYSSVHSGSLIASRDKAGKEPCRQHESVGRDIWTGFSRVRYAFDGEDERKERKEKRKEKEGTPK